MILCCVIVCIAFAATARGTGEGAFIAAQNNTDATIEQTATSKPNKPKAGDILQAGDVIVVGKVQITYNGYYEDEIEMGGFAWERPSEHFTVHNENKYGVFVYIDIVGIKKNGNEEWLGTVYLGGVDTQQYKDDLEENGWAVEKATNIAAPKSSLDCMTYALHMFDEENKDDVDKDGYYDIRFVVNEEGKLMKSEKSDVFKLKTQQEL